MKKEINKVSLQFNKDKNLTAEDEYLFRRALEAMFNKDMELFIRLSDDNTEIPGFDEFDKRMLDKIGSMYKESKKH